MNENLQKFLEYASENEDVRQKLDELKNETDKDVIVAKVVEVAKEAGFTLSAAGQTCRASFPRTSWTRWPAERSASA